VVDASVPLSVSLYAYSTLVPSDVAASGKPAVMFTLTVTNPGASAATADFLLTQPMPAINDCVRTSSNVIAGVPAATPQQCVALCAGKAGCASWTFNNGTCALASDVPHSVHVLGHACGVAGSWSSDGVRANWVQDPLNAPGGPANGDVTLQPLAAGGASISLGVSNDPAALLAAFMANGNFATSGAGVTGGVFSGVAAAIGGATVSLPVPPGATVSATIIFAWYFPYRDHMGVTVGNGYGPLYDSSVAVANSIDPVAVVNAINAHHGVFASPGSPLPAWMQDFAINEMSHFRGMMWLVSEGDGGWQACATVPLPHGVWWRAG